MPHYLSDSLINALFPGWCGYDLKCVNLKHNMGIDIISIKENITMEWMPRDLIDGNSVS